MTIDLTQGEHVVLKQILDAKVTALVHELAHTDDRSYREYVKCTLSLVEQIQAKLELGLTPSARPCP